MAQESEQWGYMGKGCHFCSLYINLKFYLKSAKRERMLSFPKIEDKIRKLMKK